MKTGWVPKDAVGQWWMYEHGQADHRGFAQVHTCPPYPVLPNSTAHPTMREAAVHSMLLHPELYELIPRDNDWTPAERLTVQEMS